MLIQYNMAKLIILRGLPASGKSTLAKELLEKHGNAIRLNKDLLREMLHFGEYSGKNEGVVWDVERSIAKELLAKGKVVIIDDTNLNNSTYAKWVEFGKELGITTETITLDTPYTDCIVRDKLREKQVGKSTIMDMAFMSHQVAEPDKGYVVYDIDGTLADIEHRRHYVQRDNGKKDWDSFFEEMVYDKPRMGIVNMLDMDIENGYGVLLVSGRSDKYRKTTMKWLGCYNIEPFHVFMRKESDKRPDTNVKRDIYNKYLAGYNIVKVVDDRPSVIRMWRDLGLNVVDVGDGIEF